MNITQFIKSNKELSKLPFLVVFRTIQILRDNGMIILESDSNVGGVQS